MSATTSYIYGLADPRTDEIRYVGQSCRLKGRYRDHIRGARLGGKSYKDNWIRTVLREGLEPKLVILETNPVAGVGEAEKAWIVTLRRHGCRLTNTLKGGELPVTAEFRNKMSKVTSGTRNPRYGKTLSPETRAKLRAANLGKKASPETRAKISAAQRGHQRMTAENLAQLMETSQRPDVRAKRAETLRGRKVTPEARANMSAAAKGKAISPETRAKISASLKGRPKPKGRRATAQQRANISAALKGRTCSTEHRANVSAAIKAWHAARKQEAT